MKKTSVVLLACILACACLCTSGCSLFNFGENEEPVALSTPMEITYTEYKVIKGDIERSVTSNCDIVTDDKDLDKCFYTEEMIGGGEHIFEKYLVKSGAEVKAGDVICVTTDGLELKAKKDGVVTYLNSEYSNLRKTNSAIREQTIMAVIDPHDINKASIIWTVSAETISDFEIGVGTEVELKSTKAGASNESFKGVIDCELSENLPEIGNSREFENWERNMSRMFSIKTDALPEDLAVGDHLSVKYTAESYKDAILVPKEAVATYRGKTFVYVKDSQGIKREKYVTVGISNEIMTQILEGLSEGDLIIRY